jgi:hypothetical protein
MHRKTHCTLHASRGRGNHNWRGFPSRSQTAAGSYRINKGSIIQHKLSQLIPVVQYVLNAAYALQELSLGVKH